MASGKPLDSQALDRILWRHLSSLPYFRGFLRAVEDRFYQEVDLPAPQLDLGSGDGHFASVAFDRQPEIGLDPWVEPMGEARIRSAYQMLVLGEGARIPAADASFNTITSVSVLEHIPEIDPVIGEVTRVLKPGGKFVFCVPNHRFPELLSVRRLLDSIGLRSLGKSYSRFFNRIARHAHTESPEIWQDRLEKAGLELVDTWDYFPPAALRILEWGHAFGLPAWVSKKLFGKWILVPRRWNLAIPWQMTRKFMDAPRAADGVCSFFIARRPA
jgi:SAM-dependent methyltransferase